MQLLFHNKIQTKKLSTELLFVIFFELCISSRFDKVFFIFLSSRCSLFDSKVTFEVKVPKADDVASVVGIIWGMTISQKHS